MERCVRETLPRVKPEPEAIPVPFISRNAVATGLAAAGKLLRTSTNNKRPVYQHKMHANGRQQISTDTYTSADATFCSLGWDQHPDGEVTLSKRIASWSVSSVGSRSYAGAARTRRIGRLPPPFPFARRRWAAENVGLARRCAKHADECSASAGLQRDLAVCGKSVQGPLDRAGSTSQERGKPAIGAEQRAIA